MPSFALADEPSHRLHHSAVVGEEVWCDEPKHFRPPLKLDLLLIRRQAASKRLHGGRPRLGDVVEFQRVEILLIRGRR